MTIRYSLFAVTMLLAGLLPQQVAAQAVTVTATKDDGVSAATHKPAGSTIIYTNTVKNTGAVDATGVQFLDPDVAHAPYVAASLTATPVARDDTYSTPVLANTSANTTTSGFNVLTNDFYGYSGGVALTQINAAVTVAVNTQPAHGVVSFNAGVKGTFTYTPTAGYTGADSFTYTLSNGVSGGTAISTTGTVNLTVAAAPVIWFVDANAGTNGTGTLASPFNTLAAFQAVNDGVGLHPAANHVIFLYESATSYSGGVTLLAGQVLVGQDSTAALSAIAGGTAPSVDNASLPVMNTGGAATTLVNASGSGVTLNSGNTLRGFIVGDTTASDIFGSAVGALTVSDVSCIGTGAIMTISTSGVLNVTLNNATSSNSASAVSLTGVNGTVSLNSGAISGAGGNDFVLNGGTANVTYAGTITNNSGNSVLITSKTGGTVLFSGAITDTGSGIALAANAGTTINFTGGLSLSTANNNAFSATGGGVVTATQNNTSIVNTISTTGGAPLTVTNTVIGAAGLTFRTIASGAGANNGITLDGTSGSGSLTVTGTGSAGTGGSITGKTGADNSLTSGIGIFLRNTLSPTFNFMIINGCQNYGIRGDTVTNISLVNCSVGNTTANGTSNTADTDASGYQGEGSVRFFNLLGTATVTNCTLDNGFAKTFAVSNTSGTLTNLTFSGCSINNNVTALTSSDALFFQTQGSSTVATLTVTGNCQFSSYRQNAIDANAQSGSTMNLFVNGSTFKNTNAGMVNASNTLVFNGSGTNTFVTFDVNTNTFTQGSGLAAAPTNAGRIMTAGSVSGACTFYGKVVSNTFGTSGVARSGGGNGADSVGLFMNGNNGSLGGSRYLVQGNTFQNYGQTGLQIGATGGNAKIDATIIGNTFRQPGPTAQGAFGGIWAYVASGAADTNVLNILIGDKNTAASKNTLTGSDPNNADDIFFGSGFSSSSVINLSKAGSSAVTAKNVLIDDNIFGADTWQYLDDGTTTINLVAGNPTAPPLLFAAGGVESADGSASPAVMASSAAVTPPALPRSAVATSAPAAAELAVGPLPAAAPGTLSQAELDAIVASALARWEATGLTPEQVTRLSRMSFEVSTLATDRLGEAGKDVIRVDARAGGNGWFIDASTQSDALFGRNKTATRSYTDAASAPAGRIDLLTTVLHEMGHALGLSDTYRLQDRDSVMYGYLTKGERRLPAMNQAKGAVPFTDNTSHFLTNSVGEPAINPLAIGTLPAGKSVIITYSVQVETPIVGATQLSSQATVHSSTASFSDVTSTDIALGVATGSGPTVTILAVPPTVTSNTASLAQNSPSMIITGTFFDTTAANNTVTFSNGAVGTVTAATSTQLTVSFSTTPTSIGAMTAVVTTPDGNSGAGVQVATVVPAPAITTATTSLGITTTTVTINGSNFSATAGNNTVVFNDGAVGTVTAATSTQLTATFSTQPTAVGSLTANVSVFGGSSGTVQVATVVPVVTQNTGNLAANAASISINGFGFNGNPLNDGITFSGAGTGTRTPSAASSTSVNSSLPSGLVAGALNAVVSNNGFTSTPAVQVATIAPVVTSANPPLAANATTVTFAGFGFDSTPANNVVTFDNGAAGTVTSASNTSLTVTFSTNPTTAGALRARVVTNGVSSGSMVQMAAVTPVVTPNAATIQNTATTLVINGFGFSPTAASNSVTFSGFATGAVTAATPTQLTVTFGTAPSLGDLNVIVSAGGQNSAPFVKVATVISLSITSSTTNLVQSSNTLDIAGTGFSTTAANNTVTFNNGAVGTVTSASSTLLTVTFSTKATSLGALNATVTVAGTGSSGPTQVATVVAGAAAKLAVINQPTNTVAGVAISPAVTVQIQDANGFLTTSTSNVTFGIGTNAGGGTLSGTTTVAAVNGTATFSTLSIDKAGTGYTLSASSGALTGATSNTFNITAAAPAKLAVGTQPTNTVSATAISPAVTVQIQDAFGNLTTSTANVVMAIGTNPSSGTLSGTTTVAAVAGTATFSTLNINKAGTGYTLSATSGALTAATSSTFNITAGAAAKLAVITQPTNAVSATAISPAVTVQIQDAAGNVTTSTANVVMAIGTNPSSGTLSGTTTVAAVAGTATFSTLSIDKAGTGYTLSATSGALTGSTSGTFNITAGAAAKLAVITQPTNTVSATAISPSVTVQIQDAAGNATTSTANVVMAIGTNPSTGTLSGTTTVAAVAGTATFSTLQIDKAGTGYTLSATSGALTGATSSAFNITAGAASKLAVITQPTNTVSATSISPAVTVQIQDAAGNVTTSTSNVTMAIGTNPSAGTLSGTTTVAAVAGTATFSTLNINKVGTGYTLSATSGVLTAATSSAFNITVGAPAKLAVITQPTDAVSAVTISPSVTVQIQDSAGNPTTSTANVVMAIGTNPNSGTLSGTTTVAAVAGTATFSTLSIDKAGTGYTLSATSGALTAATSSAFNITAGAAAKLAVIAQPTNTVSATSISPAVTVQIQDAAGNVTTSTANVVMAIGTNPSSGTLSGTTTVAAVAGTATFSTLKIDKAGTGYTLGATSGVLTATTSNAFNITAGAAAKLAVISQPTNTVSAVAISPAVTVQIQDAAGNLTTSTANVVMAIGTNPSSGTLSGTTTVAAVAGTATFSTLNIDKAGTGYTLSATSGVLTAATSNAFNITAGAAAKLAVIAQPTNAVSAVAISPAVTVQIQDAAGNLTTSTANVVMAIGTNPSSGTLSGTTTVAAVSGVATFSTLNIDKAGTGYTLSATSGVLTSATSSAFNITAGAAAKLAVGVQPSTAVAGVAISPAVTVQIQDAAGNLTTSTASVVMAIGTNPSSGTLSGSTTVAAVGGTATFSTLNINKAGTGYTLSASSGALTGATSNTFNITAAAPAKLAVGSQPTNAVSATAISPAVTVQIQDAFGNLTTSTANVVMAIGTNPSSGTLSGTTTVAAVAGTATFSTLNIDKAGTGYTLSATSGALTSATSSAFNITAGAPAKLAVGVQPSTAVAGVAISPAVTVQVQDAAGNLTTSTASVTMAIGTNPGSGTLSGTTTVNAVAGTATFSTLSIDKVGTGYTLGATSGALTSATSSAFNITPAAAASLALNAPGTAAAGTAVSVSVTAKDAFGNTATGYSGTVQFTSTDANAILPANSTLTSGAGNFNVTFENAGSFTVTGTDTVTASITGTTGDVTVSEAITIAATDATAAVGGVDTGTYRFTRGGNGAAVTVNFALNGASTASVSEFSFSGGTVIFNGSAGSLVIPAGSTGVDLTLTASANASNIAKPSKTVRLNVATGSTYTVGSPSADTVTIAQNGFVVFNTSDSGEGSLRQAIANANALAGDDTITFDSMIFGGSAQTITLSSGSLNVSGNGKAVVVAPAVGLIVSGGNVDRVFTTSGTADLTLYGMAIFNGSASGNGGGILVNAGALTVIESVIAGNTASASGGGVASASGSTVRIINSTLSGNTANGTGAAGGIDSAGTLTLLNSTLSGNSVATTNAANAGGLKQAGTASILSTTITNNSTGGSVGAGGVLVSSGTVTVGNTLIAANVNNSTTADISGAFTSAGNNLIGNKGTATGFTNGSNGDQVGTGAALLDPKIGALANNGGTTQTHILLSGSPAINAGNSALLPADTFDLDGDSNVAEALPLDQRGVGFPRIQGSTVDVGAVEGLIFTPALTATTTNEDVQSSSGLVITANSADAGGTTNYQITAITGGTLYKNDGSTAIASNGFITKAEGAAGLRFTPSANLFSPTTTFGFSVQASISADSSGLKDAVVPASITVNPVADTPSVTGTSTTVNIQSTSGLVITRNAVDSTEVAFFKITNIQHGTLYLNNGSTAVNAGDFISAAQGGAGLKFTPAVDFIGVASFDVQGSVDNAGTGLGSGIATASIAVGTVNPTPIQLVPTDPVTGLPLPAGSSYPVAGQTGTFEVRTNIKNTTAFPINGFRLSVDYSAYLAAQPSLRLYNSSSAPGVVPAFIDYPFPVAVGETVSLKLQFYTSTRKMPNPFSPTLAVTTLAASEVSSTDGSGVQPRINVRPNGTVLLEWDSIPGHWYRVKYSADVTNWFDSPVPVQAAANRTQWLDDGAPFTNVSPATVPQRFYRVNEIAAPTP